MQQITKSVPAIEARAIPTELTEKEAELLSDAALTGATVVEIAPLSQEKA